MGSLRRTLLKCVAFDLRALAIFRFSLGIMLVIDLVCRSGDLIAHYCDDGMLPRKNLLEFSAKSWYVSLHLISGQPIVQTVLFLMAAGFGVLLAIGYRTWLMTFLSWGMLLSLHARNPLILNDGDAVLRMLLFWSLFLPLGARWSSDSCSAIAGSEPEKQNVATVGTFCYACQISVIYLFAGLLKTGDSWSNGIAVAYALEFDCYGKPWRSVLLQSPALMEWLTYSTIALEKYGWLLLFIPFKNPFLRCVVIVAFVTMHLGFCMTMTLGIFPWVCIASWLPFVPSAVIDRLVNVMKSSVAIFPMQATLTYGSNLLSGLPVSPSNTTTKLGIIGSGIALSSLALIVASNLTTVSEIKLPSSLLTIARYLRITQRWELFAPNPPMDDGWFIVNAHLADGREFDLLSNQEMTLEKPKVPARIFRNHRERKYFRNLLRPENKELRKYCVASMGKRWNLLHKDTPLEIETIQLIYMSEPTRRDGSAGEISQQILWRHWFHEKYRSRFYSG